MRIPPYNNNPAPCPPVCCVGGETRWGGMPNRIFDFSRGVVKTRDCRIVFFMKGQVQFHRFPAPPTHCRVAVWASQASQTAPPLPIRTLPCLPLAVTIAVALISSHARDRR